MLPFGAFVAGSLAIAAGVAALAYGSRVLRRALLPDWVGPHARLAELVIALAAYFSVLQALGTLHLFSAIPVLLGELLAGAALAAVGAKLGGRARLDPRRVRVEVSKSEVAIAMVGAGLVVLQWSTHVAYALDNGMTHPDTVWYHQPFAATFVQQHAFTGIDRLGYDAARWFPFNAQLVHATGLLAYGRDILSPFVNLGWLALALLGAWCVGHRRGVGHVALLGAAAALSLPSMVATQPGQASSDVACAALLLAAVALLLEGRLAPVPVTLAGLAAGMALSTKITIAVPIALLAGAVPTIALVQRRIAAACCWTGAFAATGSFWFLRNWVIAGTPLPWFDIDAGPIHWPAQIPPSAPSLAHDVTHLDAWRDLYLDGIWQGLGRAWPLVLVLLVGAIAVAVARGPGTLERLVGAVLAAGVVGYVFTPLTGGFGFVFNLRYLGPVFVVAFAFLPVALPSPPWWRRIAVAALAVVVAADLTMPNRERIPAWPSGLVVPSLLVAGAGVALLAVLVRSTPRSRWRATPLVGVAMWAALWPAQRHYLEHRYVDAGLDNDAINAYFRDVRDARVVVFGTDETLPMFGLDLSNRVARGDVPAIAVGPDACRTWRQNLRGRADYVVLVPIHFGYFVVPPEQTLAGDPAARLVLRAGTSTVYRIIGELDAASCPPNEG